MNEFPRTTVGGVSVSRLIIGTNWFLGYSHTSKAKDNFIKSYQDRKRIAEIITTFFQYGVDTVMCPYSPLIADAVKDAQDRTGRKGILILTPLYDVMPNGSPFEPAEKVFDDCQKLGATFCFPHQAMTDVLIDRLHRNFRDLDKYTRMIRDRGMIPGLSTHMPESVQIADECGADVETYIQIYNAAGFLMQVEVDWIMRVIHQAKKPVITIKPLAAGRLMPVVGLGYVWNTIREQDMVTIGTTTPDEAREVIELSLDFIHHRLPDYELQETRSKSSIKSANKH
ncbi:MAG: hypothetical protein HPY85_03605 [Anaerolineae bacterium]|nr:hypothetical protein [Anaerolineae bacterium]